jgi:hypothetical protein
LTQDAQGVQQNESQHAGPAGWDAISSSCLASADDELACGDGCLLSYLQAQLCTVLPVALNSQHGGTMGQPRRFQPTRSARSAGLTSGAWPSTTLPVVLEHSTLRLSDIMRSSECVAGEGIPVKLFPVSPKHIQSVGDSKRTLWIVSSPNASNGFLSKWEDAQKSRAKTSQSTKAGSPDERRAKAKLTNGKANGRRLLARGKRKRLTSDERGKGDDVEPDDTSDE